MNQPLLEAPISVWALVAGAVQKAGGKTPDIDDIVKFVAESIGSTNFGTLRVAEAYQPKDAPFDALQRQCSKSDQTIKSMPHNTTFTGWYFALAAQKVILQDKERFDPSVAGQIVMEAAVSMAKIDPLRIGLKN